MLKRLTNKKKKGFTLIELIIVIAIIAILAAIAIPKFATIRKNANITTDIANAKNIQSVVAQGIANEKITLPASATAEYELDSIGTTSTPYDATKNLEAAGIKSKVKNAKFKVELDSAGNIIVTAGGEEVYPVAKGDFIKD